MKKIIIILMLLVSKHMSCQDIATPTVFYFIRHAEKQDQTKDSNLSQKGIERAQKWSKIFKNIPFDAILSTNFKRTKNTVLPISESKKIPIQMHEGNTFDIQKVKQIYLGKNILVVGHSNTTPHLVNELIQQKRFEILDENNYSTLFIVTIFQNQSSVSSTTNYRINFLK